MLHKCECQRATRGGVGGEGWKKGERCVNKCSRVPGGVVQHSYPPTRYIQTQTKNTTWHSTHTHPCNLLCSYTHTPVYTSSSPIRATGFLSLLRPAHMVVSRSMPLSLMRPRVAARPGVLRGEGLRWQGRNRNMSPKLRASVH